MILSFNFALATAFLLNGFVTAWLDSGRKDGLPEVILGCIFFSICLLWFKADLDIYITRKVQQEMKGWSGKHG